jgi:hypothetical protein
MNAATVLGSFSADALVVIPDPPRRSAVRGLAATPGRTDLAVGDFVREERVDLGRKGHIGIGGVDVGTVRSPPGGDYAVKLLPSKTAHF